jgi:subtilisin family serine protease
VGAAGNEGGNNFHISRTFSQPNDTLRTFLARGPGQSLYADLDIWGDQNRNYSVQLVSYSILTGEEIPISEVHTAATSSNANYRLQTGTHGAAGRIWIYTERNRQNQKANATIIVNLTSINPSQRIGLKITASTGTVRAWISSSFRFSSENVAGWTNGDNHSTVGEIGGTGKRIISVGAYVSTQTNNGALYDIANFSSRGPTADGRMKPDITAPGSTIIASYSGAFSPIFTPSIVYTNIVDGQRYHYGRMQGTSMSAPFVTGVLATWLQARPKLTPEEVRTILQETAINDDFTGDIRQSGSNTWGFGKIDAWNGIKKTLELDDEKKSDSKDDIVLRVDMKARTLHLELTNPEVENIQMNIFSISGQLIMTQKLPFESATEIIDVSNIGSGVFIVSFTGKNLNTRAKRIILP